MAVEFDHTSRQLTLRQRWSVVTSLLVAMIFAQAVFAGLMLSGSDWARTAHVLTAVVLTASSVIAGVVAAGTLRRTTYGGRLAFTLLLLAAMVLVQVAIGRMSARGSNLMWLHVPLGVMLVGVAGQSAAIARRLGLTLI